MHKKTAKNNCLTSRRAGKAPRSSGSMRVLQPQTSANFDWRSSSSWDRQMEQGSWSEDVEDAASRKILEHWRIAERTLFDEEEQLPPGPLFDECLQWRNQLPHLRILGKGLLEEDSDEGRSIAASSKSSSAPRSRGRIAQMHGKGDELDNLGTSCDSFSRKASIPSATQQNHRQAKEEVLNHIVEFICRELAEIEAEKEAEDLSDNFDNFLKIAPAPTCTGKNPLVSNNFYYSVEKPDSPMKKDKDENREKDKEKDLRVGRNKLGAVFNKRIIVSPVPFVVTTRESFSTIRRTPVQFLGDNHDDIHTGSRRENTRRKLSITRKAPLIAAPHVQSSWNTPVCPTIWPKNVKLTPIDTSRLPSGKRRPSKTAESIPPRRSRNSLSPILPSVQPTSPHSSNIHNINLFEGLEIRGSHIVPLDGKLAKAKLMRAKRVESQL